MLTLSCGEMFLLKPKDMVIIFQIKRENFLRLLLKGQLEWLQFNKPLQRTRVSHGNDPRSFKLNFRYIRDRVA